jgi:hypothetical protein
MAAGRAPAAFAAVAPSGASRAEHLAAEAQARRQAFACLPRPFAALVPVGPLAHLAWTRSAAALPAFAAPDTAAELRGPAAGGGSSCCAAQPAAPGLGSASRSTAADTWAAALAAVQRCGSTGPIRIAAAPTHVPNGHPTVAAHRHATRESTAEVAGSNAPERAGRTPEPPPGPPATTVRCTRNSRTSCPAGRPSTCHRRRRSSRAPAARNRRGSQAPERTPDKRAG